MNPAADGSIHKTSLQWRQAQHQLQVLGNEQQGAEPDDEAEYVGGQGCVEGGVWKQTQVQQRIGQY